MACWRGHTVIKPPGISGQRLILPGRKWQMGSPRRLRRSPTEGKCIAYMGHHNSQPPNIKPEKITMLALTADQRLAFTDVQKGADLDTVQKKMLTVADHRDMTKTTERSSFSGSEVSLLAPHWPTQKLLEQRGWTESPSWLGAWYRL